MFPGVGGGDLAPLSYVSFESFPIGMEEEKKNLDIFTPALRGYEQLKHSGGTNLFSLSSF